MGVPLAAGQLHTLCICILSMSIWMSIIYFSISETQWHVLEFFKHPLQATGALQANCRPRMRPLYMSWKDVNMDVYSEFGNLTNSMVGLRIL